VVIALGGGNTVARIALFDEVTSVLHGFNTSKGREILAPESVNIEFVVRGNTFKEFNGEFTVGPAVFNFRFKRGDNFAHFR
jgi:hypothetical protein